MRAWSFFLLAAVVAAQSQTGEVTTRNETPTFQSSVNLVRVPVVVRDKQGHTLGTFHKEDFQLTDRGKPQYISQFAIEGSAVPKPAAQPAAEAQIPGEPATPGSKLLLPTRFTAYVFDDINSTLEDFTYARIAALKHIERGIPPQDRVALVTLSGKVSLEFTDDAAKFREALMKVVPQPPHHTSPPASFYVADRWVNHDDQSALSLETQITIDCLNLSGFAAASARSIADFTLREVASEGTTESNSIFHTLSNIVRLLGSMPGDRVIILVSPGFYLPDDLQKGLTDSIDRATRSGVIINTLDVRGVYTLDPTGEVPGCHSTSPQTAEAVARYDRLANLVQGMVLDDLTQGTGGSASSNNDMLGGFNRLADPPEYVYYLGFYPKDLKPDGKYHEIKVKLVDSKGFSVQARKGYWAPSHEEDEAATAKREIGEAVFSRDELHDLPIDIHTQFYKTGPDDAKVKVTSHLDIGQLRLRKQDDRNRNDVTLVCALFDRNGVFVKGTQKLVELRLKDGNVERWRKNGFTLSSDFDVKAGPYMIRVVVRDAEGRQMAATNGVVEIP
ncbi:MAG: VWA domain-containing protein [Bryobacteraceae bacterium]|jgi:VWFA-related protein